MNAAQKAWATRRARLAAEKAAPLPPPAPARRKRQLVDRIGALVAIEPEKTAGQKAAESRAIALQARAELEARRAGVEQPSALAECKTVRMWVDDAKVGCGFRNFVVVEIGTKVVRLFSAPALREIDVSRYDFDKYAKPYVSRAGSLARIIDSTASSFDRLGLDYQPRIVRAVRAAVAA